MRTKNLFRTLVAATLAVVSTSAFAQPFLTTSTAESAVKTDADEATDYVTVGSIMPYSVVPDANILALDGLGTVNQIFLWSIAPAGPTITTQIGGAVTPAAAPDATYIDESAVAYEFPATGAFTISVNEKSQFLADPSMSCTDVTPSTLPIEVVAEPTVVWNDADRILGGCNVAGTGIAIPVTVTGTDLFQLTYTQTYYDLAGAPTVVGPTTTLSLGASDIFLDFTNTENVNMYTLNIPAATYGRYEITISSVTDRISRKSLNNYVTETSTYGSQDPGGLVGTTFTVYSFPTPSTGAVRHVTNLGW